MKYSTFNNLCKINQDICAIYNSLSREIVFINSSHATTSPKDLPAAVQERLIAGGFLIENSINEYNLIKEIRNAASNQFSLIINPTLNCNFNCWYCYESHIPKSQMDDHTISKIKALISSLANKYDSLQISFFGGEPLLYYNSIVKSIMDFTTSSNISSICDVVFSFTSNGYLITDNLINDLKNFKISHLQITLDGGKESHDQTRVPASGKSYDRIIYNIKILLSANIPVILRLNLTHDTITTAFSITDSFNDISLDLKKNLSVSIQQIWQDRNNEDDISNKFLELYQHFYIHGIKPEPPMRSRLLQPCYADRPNTIVANYNGDIFKCTAIDFSNTEREGFISDYGEIIYEKKSLDKLNMLRDLSTKCHSCRILPICNGGCFKSIRYTNNGSIVCPYPTNEDKDAEVRNIVNEYLFLENLSNTK